MQWMTAKTPADIGLEGAEYEIIDKLIVEVRIGNVRIRKGENYGKALEILVEKPREKVEKHRLTVKVKGFPDAVTFHDDNYSAERAMSDYPHFDEYSIDAVTVEVDDAGSPVDDLPF